MRVVNFPPGTPVESVVEFLHGIPVSDPYRWLEDQNSPQTHDWIEAQKLRTRSYLDGLPGRNRIRERIRSLLDVETYDSFLSTGDRYFFRKRVPGQEQPSIYLREGANGQDRLLIDPARRGTGNYTAVRPLSVSVDGKLLLYEVKQGGEGTGVFEIFDVSRHEILPDSLPHGYLRGFAFAPDGKGFYYVHEATHAKRSCHRAVYHRQFGGNFHDDREIFCAGDDARLRLALVAGQEQLGFLVYRFLENPGTDFYLWQVGSKSAPRRILGPAEYSFIPAFVEGRILAETDLHAPNGRIVEVVDRHGHEPLFVDLIPESDARVQSWVVSGGRIFVSYIRRGKTEVAIFTVFGDKEGFLPNGEGHTVRLVFGNQQREEILFERESLTSPPSLCRYDPRGKITSVCAERKVPFPASDYHQEVVWYSAEDGTPIPMLLAGRRDIFSKDNRPTVMTSYGGFGVSTTPQFSVLVAFLMELGCLCALPNIRGGSEFGASWHEAAKRRKRQIAVDDFLSAAHWLVNTGRTDRKKLAIFGGSNSGLLVGVALTQQPELFCAALCIVPLFDMLRYHLFDHASIWKKEFGTSDDPSDFLALLGYSPYHRVRDKTSYPATMIVSGDADQKCNPMHSRKMTARLQAANSSANPILLDYSEHRGHSPVLPLSERVNALVDRVAFLSHQLQLTM